MGKNRSHLLMVSALCLAVAAQAWMSLRTKSLTFDELTYIPAGYTYVVAGDYRLNPEHPPLAKLLAGVALLPVAPRLDLAHESWRSADQWAFGEHFFETAGADTTRLVSVARIPGVLLMMALVVVAYLMARRLYGPPAGLLAAWLCAFSPNLLAHGRLATTDFGQALFVLATAYAFLRFVRLPSIPRGLVAGMVLGLALLTKYSAVMLLGLTGVWALEAALTRRPGDLTGWSLGGRLSEGFGRGALLFGTGLAGVVVVGLFVVSLAYGTPGDPIAFGRNLGTLYTNVHLGLPTYFAGRFHEGGLPYYFVAAFLLKTPVAFLALLAVRIVDQARRREVDRTEVLYLLLPAVLWVVVMTVSALQFGVRYILPAYPLLFVYAAGITSSPLFRDARGSVAVVLLAGFFAASSLKAFPHYIPYFNLLAGGPSHGIEWLDDSNVDWGQDLPLLAEWLEGHDIHDATIVPMALYDPALYGVEGRVVAPEVVLPLLASRQPPPGVYAVSAHLLTRVRWGGEPEVDPLRDLSPAAVLGYSIYVFDLR